MLDIYGHQKIISHFIVGMGADSIPLISDSTPHPLYIIHLYVLMPGFQVDMLIP